jgi:hypothetical protein
VQVCPLKGKKRLAKNADLPRTWNPKAVSIPAFNGVSASKLSEKYALIRVT